MASTTEAPWSSRDPRLAAASRKGVTLMRQSATEAGTNRRDFLTASATGAVALGALPFPSGVHAAGSDTIKIGMIGCGDRCTGCGVSGDESRP